MELTEAIRTTDTVGAATLVVPLDGSREAAAALPVARTLAEAESATIHVVHIGGERLPPGRLVEHLGVAAGELAGAVLVHRVGTPAGGIVGQARDLGSRLIVMSSRAAQDASRGSLGESTREVLRRAPCPVVLVPPDRPPSPWPLRRILLPHDGIPTTATAIARATELARRAGAELAVLHIAAPSSPPPGGLGALTTPRYLDQPQHEWPAWAREFVDRFTALGGSQQAVRMHLFLACGEPADAIVAFASEHHTDLIVIAWVRGWEPEQRTTMRKVIDQAPGPLMIFPLEEPKNGLVF
jgi:nucleotide-binding universal stress UspA family protein